MLFTIAHELTHFIRQNSPAKFDALADIVVNKSNLKGKIPERIEQKMREAEDRGEPISRDTAYEEVIADSMETILTSGRVLEMMNEVKKQDKTLWEQIRDWFMDFIKSIREAYSGVEADTVEGQAIAEMDDVLKELEQVFAEGLVDAGENFQTAEKNTTHGGVKLMAREDSARIKEQIKSVSPALNKMDLAASVKTDGFKGMRKSDIAKEIEKEYAKIGNKVDRQNFGTILLEYKQINKALEYLYTEGEYAALLTVPRVLKRGIIADSHTEHKDRQIDSFTIAAPVEINGQRGNVGVVVQRVKGTNRFKTLRILLPNGKAFEFVKNTEADSTAGSSSKPKGLEGIPIESASKKSIRSNERIVNPQSAEDLDISADAKTESVAPSVLKSERTWKESDYVQERDKAASEIAKAIGVTEQKAKDYIDSVNSIAKMIADDRVRLDYFSSPGRSSFVSNVEYGGSFDFSTLCKKRRLLTGTFTAIQKALPNTALTANEILEIRNRMKEANLEVSCGLCYVEGSRANMGQFAKEFLRLYKQYYPDGWQPNMADVNTPDGIEWVRINHPEVYEQYEYFWNHYGTLKPGDKNLFASQQKPKLYQLHTEYKGEILQKFNDDDNVEEKNLNGGIRLQSFSDFEIVHLIDTMQIIMDMLRVGLAGQAYTKVPDFAWALGDTGLKINLSLIAKGVDENGKLIFDDIEGMPIAEAMKLRDRYSKNVGTILVAFNDEQLMAAMADERVDFIIPFHRSQWKKSQYAAMGLPAKTKDYTFMQNEKFIKPQYHEYRGRMVKDKATNYMPNEYWDFNKTGKQNAEAYLEMCARNNKRPKFYKLLQNNGDGSYSLKADGSTDGYWKLLIDFKMYDNDGIGSPQTSVKPEFNMDEAMRMLNDYKGGHSNFPVAQGIVDSFVEEYKTNHPDKLYSSREQNWKPKLDSTEWGIVNYAVDNYQGTEITSTCNMFLKKSKGRTVFGIYSTEDSTLLYASTNKKAEKEATFVDRLAKEYENGDATDKGAKNVRAVIEELRMQQASNNSHVPGLGASGRYAGNGRVHGATYGRNTDPALRNVLENIFEKDIERRAGNERVKKSNRTTESLSTRSILANALEGVAQNEWEQNKRNEYKENIAKVEEMESRLQEINSQLYPYGKKMPQKERIALQDEAVGLRNKITNIDKKLLRLEATKPLQNVLNRERARVRREMKQKADERISEVKAEAAQRLKRRSEGHAATEMRKKIRKTIRELDKILNRGDKKRNVKEGMKDRRYDRF